MTYIPLEVINAALGSEANGFTTVTEIANDIIFDKTTLANTLTQFGIPSSPSESLIDLINKVHPLSVNYILHFADLFNSSASNYTGNSDSLSANLFTVIPVTLSDLFDDSSLTYFSPPSTGSVWFGGDAQNTTQSKNFVIFNVVSSTQLQIDSTAGMAVFDVLQQGAASTSIHAIIDIQNLTVVSTTGFVARTLAASF